MKHFNYSLLAAAGILVLAFVLTAAGPKRVMAALGYTPVRDIDNPGRQPFAAGLLMSGEGGTYFVAPPGKRVVITDVSAMAVGAANDYLEIQTDVTVTGNPSRTTYFDIPYSTRGTRSFANANGVALAQADPNSFVAIYNHGPSNGQVNIHGYLVDVP